MRFLMIDFGFNPRYMDPGLVFVQGVEDHLKRMMRLKREEARMREGERRRRRERDKVSASFRRNMTWSVE